MLPGDNSHTGTSISFLKLPTCVLIIITCECVPAWDSVSYMYGYYSGSYRKQRRLLRILARLDRQISPPPSSTPAQGSTEAPPPSPAQTWDDKTTTNTNTKSPSWLRSESTNTQTTSPNMVFGDRHDNAPPHGPTRTSTRSSGITRPLLSRQFDSNPDLSTSDLSSRPSSSRPVSGRMSGLRGELYSQQKSRPPSHTPLASFSDPHLPTFLDSDATPPASLDETIGSSHGEPQRLQTAVLAKGRRTIRLSSSGSDTCLVPCIGDDVITTPTLSHAEPDLSSTQFDPRHSHSHHMERQSVNECLESISKFDHLHLGQIGSNIQG